jgi:preprotein translocase subunit SecE
MEQVMSKSITLTLAVLAIFGIIFWAINSTRQRTYEGADLTFVVGSGSVIVTNSSDNEIPVAMRSEGRTASFRVTSTDFDLNATSTRQGSGRVAYHGVEFNLPPGQATIDVTRGNNVQFISSSATRIAATVIPMGADEAQTTYMIAVVVVLASLFFISNTTEHQWISFVRSKLPIGNSQLTSA